jgi:hypothetical protein
MKIVVACCAILFGLVECAPALSAPLRSIANPFDQAAPRPPHGIPNVRLPNRSAAMAPLPRAKPAEVTTPPAPGAAPVSGPIVFPPVAPLE